ncbi:hypothetical protein [Pandoraea sp. NPDC087047]|uniref:hypothetical protein n=1 Tax=Pandoraea sp. NPDC087047 TaxID=3364390 RepID=UPI0037F33D4E
MYRTRSVLGAFSLFLASSSVALAATTSCPAVSSITQTPSGDGFAYTAKVDGIQWKGEHPRATSDMIKDLKFDVAYLLAKQGMVACEYRADPKFGGGLRMVVTRAKSLRASDQWAPETQPGGNVLPRCSAADPTQCRFDIAK